MVFCVGPPRSGTLMIARVLDSHPQVTAIHEPGPKSEWMWFMRIAWRDGLTALGHLLPEADALSAFWFSYMGLPGPVVHLVRPATEWVCSVEGLGWFEEESDRNNKWGTHVDWSRIPSGPYRRRLFHVWAHYHEVIQTNHPDALRVRPGSVPWQQVFSLLGVDPHETAAEIEAERPHRTEHSGTEAWTPADWRTYEKVCAPLERALLTMEVA